MNLVPLYYSWRIKLKLYHGTSEAVAKIALKEGLKPRGTRKGNWKHTVDSRKDAVYMTDIYGPYFAYSATKDGQRAAVIEIDLDRLDKGNLIPDEDFLEQATRTYQLPGMVATNLTMKQRTLAYRKIAAFNKQVWEDSLKHLGTVSHLGIIPPDAMTRVAYIDVDKQSHFVFQCADASISLMNHKLCHDKYANATKHLFDGGVNAVEYCGYSKEIMDNKDAGFDYFRQHVAQTEQMLSNREGIEVLALT